MNASVGISMLTQLQLRLGKGVMSCLVVFLLMAQSANSQIAFFKIFSNAGYDYGEGITEWKDSSYFVCGSSTSFQDAPSDAFLLKISKTGDFEWSKNYGGSESDLGRRILNWNDSIFYITGYSNSGNAGEFNFALWKVDTAGNLLTQKQVNIAGWERLNDALIVQDSALYMVGEMTGTSNGFADGFIVKTNLNGDTLWTLSTGGIGDDELHDVYAINDTSFYAVGETFVADSNKTKAWIVHFDHHGTLLWSKYYGQDNHYILNDIYLKSGVLCGVGTHTYRPLGDQDEFLLKIDLNGNVLFEDSYHADGDVVYDQVTPYGSNNRVYISSHYKNQFSAGGSTDVGITRFYDALVWDVANVSIGFAQDELNRALIATKDGGAIAVGHTLMDGLGGSGAYVLKIGPNDVFPTVSETNIESLLSVIEFSVAEVNLSMYPNPATTEVHITLDEIANISVANAQGKVIYVGSTAESSAVSVSDWNPGVYFVTLQLSDGCQSTRKLIIQ